MNDDKPTNIRVIDEYERVLSNPSNIIVSDELQELIDMPLGDEPVSSFAEPEDFNSEDLESLALTLLDQDGLSLGARGELSSIYYEGDVCSISIDCHKVRHEVLSLLESKARGDYDTPLILSGMYNAEVKSASLEFWSVERVAPHTTRLTIKFRSEDVIF